MDFSPLLQVSLYFDALTPYLLLSVAIFFLLGIPLLIIRMLHTPRL